MSMAQFQLIDLQGTHSTLTFSHYETGTEYNHTATPSEEDEEVKNALVTHPIPGLDKDRGQDMGGHSDEFTISGICTLGDKNSLKTRAKAAQLTSSYPGGRWRVKLISAASQSVYDVSGLAIKNARFRLMAGFRSSSYRYWITFIDYQE